MIVLLNEGGIIDPNSGIIDPNGGIIENAAPSSSLFTYLRPDGITNYLRPDGTSTYKRP